MRSWTCAAKKPRSSILGLTTPLHFSAREEETRELESKRKMEKGSKISQSVIWVLLIFAIFDSVACVEDKCAACSAVAEELEVELSNEKPRNHLDMRHRLDSKGQREGKVIDYRVSELRVVELLDGLCEKMQDYTLKKVDSERQEWVKVDDWSGLTTDKQEARAHAKYISTYCGRLLEQTEDELAELIKKGAVRAESVRKVLCQDLSEHCSSTSSSSNRGDDRLDGEL